MAKTKKPPNKKAKERICWVRKKAGKTLEDFSDIIDKSVSSLKEYEAGTRAIPLDVAKALTRQFGMIPQYWLGETDARTKSEYIAYLDGEAAALSEDFWPEGDDYSTQQAELRSMRVALFSLCGFRYEDLSETAAYDFAEFDPESSLSGVPGPHKIVPLSDNETATYFSEADLETMLSKIHELIEYECFCQRKKQK